MARAGRLRIIGGCWRGRRVEVPDSAGLRPTGDRIRETLFNWLAPALAHARVLDLFAGTGALGLEALSRGAADAVFVEQSRPAAQSVSRTLARLGAEDISGRVICDDALRYLQGTSRHYDLVFLDPPFSSAIIEPACDALESREWLAPGALIYLEYAASGGDPVLPQRWLNLRKQVVGGVACALCRRALDDSEPMP